MLMIYLGGLAILCALIATPWRAPQLPTTFTHPYVLIVAGLIQVPVLLLGKPASAPLISALLVALWLLCNLHLPGSRLVLIGVIGNALAMAVHGGAMPLAPKVAQQLNVSEPAHMLLPRSKDVIGQDGIWLWLSDWLILQLPNILLVVSPGDICIVVGLVYWTCVCRYRIKFRSSYYAMEPVCA